MFSTVRVCRSDHLNPAAKATSTDCRLERHCRSALGQETREVDPRTLKPSRAALQVASGPLPTTSTTHRGGSRGCVKGDEVALHRSIATFDCHESGRPETSVAERENMGQPSTWSGKTSLKHGARPGLPWAGSPGIAHANHFFRRLFAWYHGEPSAWRASASSRPSRFTPRRYIRARSVHSTVVRRAGRRKLGLGPRWVIRPL